MLEVYGALKFLKNKEDIEQSEFSRRLLEKGEEIDEKDLIQNFCKLSDRECREGCFKFSLTDQMRASIKNTVLGHEVQRLLRAIFSFAQSRRDAFFGNPERNQENRKNYPAGEWDAVGDCKYIGVNELAIQGFSYALLKALECCVKDIKCPDEKPGSQESSIGKSRRLTYKEPVPPGLMTKGMFEKISDDITDIKTNQLPEYRRYDSSENKFVQKDQDPEFKKELVQFMKEGVGRLSDMDIILLLPCYIKILKPGDLSNEKFKTIGGINNGLAQSKEKAKEEWDKLSDEDRSDLKDEIISGAVASFEEARKSFRAGLKTKLKAAKENSSASANSQVDDVAAAKGIVLGQNDDDTNPDKKSAVMPYRSGTSSAVTVFQGNVLTPKKIFDKLSKRTETLAYKAKSAAHFATGLKVLDDAGITPGFMKSLNTFINGFSYFQTYDFSPSIKKKMTNFGHELQGRAKAAFSALNEPVKKMP